MCVILIARLLCLARSERLPSIPAVELVLCVGHTRSLLFSAMDEVVPGLWLGNLPSALDVQGLKAKKIFSIVTAMRGKVTIHAVSFHSFHLDAIFTQLSRPSTNTKLISTIVQTKMSWCTSCRPYRLSKPNLTVDVLSSFIVKPGSVSIQRYRVASVAESPRP